MMPSANNTMNDTTAGGYPKEFFDGQDNNSAGFVSPTYINTGATRGDQTINGRIIVMDANGTVRMVLGYEKGAF